jgi:predicted nucleic acid-binding protein
MAKVYLETSFFSACAWDHQDPRSLSRQDESRRWWVQQRRLHELSTSAEVIRELSDPTFRNREQALALTAEVMQLPLTEDVLGLAQVLVRERVMPGPAEYGDAMHVAVSVVHGIDYLLTWNVRHLANPNKLSHLRTVFLRAGYVMPNIVTPEALWQIEGDVP